jgi:hypothetical protein
VRFLLLSGSEQGAVVTSVINERYETWNFIRAEEFYE